VTNRVPGFGSTNSIFWTLRPFEGSVSLNRDVPGGIQRHKPTPERESLNLGFTKVMEFVSQTVVRRKVTELGRLKLLSARALDPDADYIRDLQKFFEEQRVYRQDQEAIKLTVKECCDPYELKPKAPKFLNKLYDLGLNATQREKDEAMAQLGESLSFTRNMIVHAKSNYVLTGRECPLDQISQFAQCSRLAAEEAVRWYHSQHENMRIG